MSLKNVRRLIVKKCAMDDQVVYRCVFGDQESKASLTITGIDLAGIFLLPER